MLKKIMLLGAAVAALVALSAPAAQAEFTWQTNGADIVENDIVSFEGDVGFHLTSGAAGTDATVEATLELYAGTFEANEVVGEVIGVHVSNCKGTGALAGTTCTNLEPIPLSTWEVTLVSENTLELDIFSLVQRYWAGSHTLSFPVAQTDLNGGVTVELDPTGVVEGTLSPGTALTLNAAPATVEGTIHKTGENKLTLD